jgi:hypothetical protein
LGPLVNPQVPNRAFTRNPTGMCTPTSFLDETEYRRLGDPVDLAMFAAGTEGKD